MTEFERNKKMIFIDLDGTLIDSSGEVPVSAIEAIQKARKNGHRVYICTGRAKSEVEQSILDIGFDGMIAAAGSYIEINGKMILNKTIATRDVKYVVDFLEKHNVYFWLEGFMDVYSSNKTVEHLREKLREESSLSNFFEQMNVVDKWIYSGINKITFLSGDISFEAVEKELCWLFHVEKSSFKKLGEDGGEITIKGTTKATGIEQLLVWTDTPLEATMAFGDGLNDVDMLKYVNIGIAMENGCDELKSIADDITTSNDNDGIYESFVKHQLI